MESLNSEKKIMESPIKMQQYCVAISHVFMTASFLRGMNLTNVKNIKMIYL